MCSPQGKKSSSMEDKRYIHNRRNIALRKAKFYKHLIISDHHFVPKRASHQNFSDNHAWNATIALMPRCEEPAQVDPV